LGQDRPLRGARRRSSRRLEVQDSLGGWPKILLTNGAVFHLPAQALWRDSAVMVYMFCSLRPTQKSGRRSQHWHGGQIWVPPCRWGLKKMWVSAQLPSYAGRGQSCWQSSADWQLNLGATRTRLGIWTPPLMVTARAITEGLIHSGRRRSRPSLGDARGRTVGRGAPALSDRQSGWFIGWRRSRTRPSSFFPLDEQFVRAQP